MLRTSFSQSPLFRAQQCVVLSPGSQFAPPCVSSVSIFVPCACVSFWQPPLRPFPFVFFRKERRMVSCRTDRVTPSFLHWWFFFLGFLPLGFPLGCFSFWYTPFGSLIPLLISLSQCLERKSVFLESQTFLGLEGTSPPCSPRPPLPSGT